MTGARWGAGSSRSSGSAEEHADDALPGVAGDAVVVVEDAEQHQRVHHHLLELGLEERRWWPSTVGMGGDGGGGVHLRLDRARVGAGRGGELAREIWSRGGDSDRRGGGREGRRRWDLDQEEGGSSA